jgi:hypothetical protein
MRNGANRRRRPEGPSSPLERSALAIYSPAGASLTALRRPGSDFPLTTFGLQASSTVLYLGLHWALYVLGGKASSVNIVILSVLTACTAIAHGGVVYLGPQATSKLWCKAASLPLTLCGYYLTLVPFFRDKMCASCPEAENGSHSMVLVCWQMLNLPA